MLSGKYIVVGAVADDPLALDIAHYMRQETDIADILAYKQFANTEFCPRFISDESDLDHIGHGLEGKTVIIVSSCSGQHTRNARAMRTFLVARRTLRMGPRTAVPDQNTDTWHSSEPSPTTRNSTDSHGVQCSTRNCSRPAAWTWS